ncbi:hypothetical protein [Desertifilum tharense]|uniref:ZIP Zinc transporter n=1 Tax=Desertifilum tharense IPPAS B-1220 TaxID=1781255 RepID=A0A1E5QFX8_9CYAN|nr:hypothetical protein [Desertifilum tharense]OEJ73559.1 hypothetical protein BH720_19065 [Desertifilum tharense IPPAS B-1220]
MSVLAFLSLIVAIGLAWIHILASRMRFLDTLPRSRWLSLAGGASVAYVFVHIFPELSKGQQTLESVSYAALGFLEHHVYLVALGGFSVFYGLERLAARSRQYNQKSGMGNFTTLEVFWLHIASFAAYNALIGYLLLHREEANGLGLLFFAIAMALHFIVNDRGLSQHHKHSYQKVGRWLLASAILVGWALGYATEIPQAGIALLFAFLAGGIILNVLKEELPEERESRFWAFILGAFVYAAILLIAEAG